MTIRQGRTGYMRPVRRVGLAAGLVLLSVTASSTSPGDLKDRYRRPDTPPFPERTPYTPEKAELGKTLFFDPRLSGDNRSSCASCHRPELGWEDGERLTESTGSGMLKRHTPTLWNLAWGRTFFWDGSAPTIEAQALMPIRNSAEMNQPIDELLAEIRNVEGYRRRFARAFPDRPEVTRDNLAKAIATYERTLVQPDTPFDRWVEGDRDAISESAKRGFELFNGKARCVACHSGWNFTAGAFHDIGLPDTGDRGRGRVLDLSAADHMFKTPTLRDIARRAPYMHDGSIATLKGVIDHYEGEFVRRDTLSADMEKIALSEAEEADLIAFLHTLTTPAAARGVDMPEIPE